jgi:hypothetical protein
LGNTYSFLKQIALLIFVAGFSFIGSAHGADINIASYGAVGNGTTDNYAVIQRALNDAANAKVGVYIPPGTFAYSPSVTVCRSRVARNIAVTHL